MEAATRAEVEPNRLLTRNFVLACVGRGAFFASMSMLLPVLPLYVVALGGGEAIIGLVVGVFTISIVILSPFIGRAADERGRKGLMLLGCLIFLAASLLYNVVFSVPLLLILRMFHGSGLASFNISSSAYSADISPPHRRGEAMGWFGMSNNVAMAVSPALGVIIYQAYGFNAVFLAAAMLSACALVLSLLLTEAKRETRRQGGARGQLLSRDALFPSAIVASLTITYGTVVAFVPLFAAKNNIENPGLYFTAWAIALLFSRVIAGVLSDRLGRAAVIVPGLLLAAIAMWMLPSATSLAALMTSAALYGLSFGAVHPTLMALAFDRVSIENRGASMGTFTMAIDTGIGAGSILLGLVLQVSDFGTMFVAAGIIPLFGIGAFAWQRITAGSEPQIKQIR